MRSRTARSIEFLSKKKKKKEKSDLKNFHPFQKMSAAS
jgi:hypothetical protein